MFDTVLEGFDVNAMKQGAVAHSLQNMFRADEYFSICTINDLIEVSQIVIPKERYDIYRSQHCIYWRDMTPEFRQTLIAMILNDFRSILNTEE